MKNLMMIDPITTTNALPCLGMTSDFNRATSALRTLDVQGAAVRADVMVAKPQAHAVAGFGPFNATTGIRLGSLAWSPPL